MKVGFTGTREGMTDQQRAAVRQWLRENPPSEVHHGNCIGADEQFSYAVVDALDALPREVIHPCDIPSMQAPDPWADEIRQVLGALERNKNIVDETDMLLVGPKGPQELRSGTWATVRYARKQGKRIVIVWPDGKVTEE